MYIERQLWQNDWHGYVHEVYRVFLSTKLKCHVFTPAGLGKISEGSTRRGTSNGLRYKVSVETKFRDLADVLRIRNCWLLGKAASRDCDGA